MQNLLLQLFALLVCIAITRRAGADTYPRQDLLVEPGQLAQLDIAKPFIILDARARAAYQQEHIPAARWVDHDTWAKAFGDGQDADGWSKRIGEIGIGADSSVVIYDGKGMKDAARIWWILRYWGVHDVRLLNGGWKSWAAEQLPTTNEAPTAIETTEFKASACSERLANKQQMLDLLHDKGVQIIDARSEKEFCGTDAQNNKRAGSMPGAKHLEWSDLIDPNTDRFKSPDELRSLFQKAQIDIARPAACHCQSGGRASVMAFGLELMGAKDVRNYYRGWSEWGNATDTPITVSGNTDTH